MWKNSPETFISKTFTIQSGLEHQISFKRNPNVTTDELRHIFFQGNDANLPFGIIGATLPYNSWQLEFQSVYTLNLIFQIKR